MRPTLPRYVQAIRAKGTLYHYFRRHGSVGDYPVDQVIRVQCALTSSCSARPITIPDQDASARAAVASMIRDYRAERRILGAQAEDPARLRRACWTYSRRSTDIRPMPFGAATSASCGRVLPAKSALRKLFTQVASALFNFGIDNDYCSTQSCGTHEAHRQGEGLHRPGVDAHCAIFEVDPAGATPDDRLHDRALCRANAGATFSR